jgi:alkylation response protein AidB-like acyl-CoA dehydrogenase
MMDLTNTDEQSWLTESVGSMLTREWVTPQDVARATPERRHRVWDELVAFGTLDIGTRSTDGTDGLEATELCLIARALGAHLASVPFLGSAAVRLALAPDAGSLPPGLASVLSSKEAIGIALLEPGASWAAAGAATRLTLGPDGLDLHGGKVAVEQLQAAEQFAVTATLDAGPALAVVPQRATGLVMQAQRCFDDTVLMGSAGFQGVPVPASSVLSGPAAGQVLDRLMTAGALLAAAEASGAADRVFGLACGYAAQRRQFGRSIGSFQALRHLLADAYVRAESGWSAVRYAAAALDEGAPEAAQAVSVAKAYVSRGAREVAHTAMQVFGGIAFTAEHPAHRFLRRAGVRAQQFGDAAHHERLLGQALAGRARRAHATTAAAEDAA